MEAPEGKFSPTKSRCDVQTSSIHGTEPILLIIEPSAVFHEINPRCPLLGALILASPAAGRIPSGAARTAQLSTRIAILRGMGLCILYDCWGAIYALWINAIHYSDTLGLLLIVSAAIGAMLVVSTMRSAEISPAHQKPQASMLESLTPNRPKRL